MQRSLVNAAKLSKAPRKELLERSQAYIEFCSHELAIFLSFPQISIVSATNSIPVPQAGSITLLVGLTLLLLIHWLAIRLARRKSV
jgi:hypothetical protein